MKILAVELENILEKYTTAFQCLEEEAWSAKPFVDKWSKKEELGHLVDSAQNNIRRFIVGQYEEHPFIIYQQNDWVTLSNYQCYHVADLVSLWILLNKHICTILKSITEEKAQRLVKTDSLKSIAWLAADYKRHLLHHIHHILDLAPIPYLQ